MTAMFSPQVGPSAAEEELVTGEAVALTVRPISFLLRGAGTLIDMLVSVAVGVGLLLLLGALAIGGAVDSSTAQAATIAILVFAIVIVPSTVEVATRGRSLGRLAVGARIVRDDGGAIQYRHAITRALVGIFELYLTLGGGAALVGLLHPRSKRIGDILAGTYSQHERVPRVVRRPRPMPAELAGWARVADAARMPDALSRRIAAFLAQSEHFTPESRERLARELAAEAAPYVAPVPAVHPETLLIGVSALRRDRDSAALDGRARRLAALSPALESTPTGFPRP